ncbi:uncharacterized protein YkwD [Aestuariispira insulae]|uniref:Uncharacterized protein YkwD n=1 Tax=Aestuariispira insulae TaxID=1461337 RepID=A0A3D9HXW7_9PROT|nr:uncharacterized protein YkwD [Aestuariispira insulae]
MRYRPLILLLGLWSAIVSLAGQGLADLSRETLVDVNRYRSARILPNHQAEPRLARAARNVARYLAERGPESYHSGLMAREVSAVRYPSRETAMIVDFNYRNQREFLKALQKSELGRTLMGTKKAYEIGIAVLDANSARLPRNIRSIWVVIAAQHDTMADAGWREGIVKYVNLFRRQHGLPPLTINPVLNRAAQYHADDMAVKDYFDHTSPLGTGPGERAKSFNYRFYMVSENLAGGARDPRETVEQWKASKDGHREAMLDKRVSEIGVGYRYLPDDRGRVRLSHYWAITMGQPYP